MSRPTIHYPVLDFDRIEDKQRIVTKLGPLTGKYEVWLEPRRGTRSQQQNRAWWSLIVKPFYEFLREQDYDVTDPEHAHAILKEKFLRVSVVNRETGEIVGHRTRSTTELTTSEFSELYMAAQAWLADQFGIVTADPDPNYLDKREAVSQ